MEKNYIIIKGTGSTKISVSFQETKHYKAKTIDIPVRVLKKQSIKVGISTKINYTEAQIPINATANGKLTYVSKTPDIVAVDKESGMIECKKNGKATIQITAAKTGEYAKTTKTFTFTIYPAINCEETIEKNISDLPSDENSNRTFNLGATINNNMKLTYSSDMENIASVDANGKVTVHMNNWNDDTSEKDVHITIAVSLTKEELSLYGQVQKKVTIKLTKLQKAKWFMNYVNISQVPGGDYSHQGTQNFDAIGTRGDNNIFAPFDCKIVAIYKELWSYGNTVIIQSLNNVQYADGTSGIMSMAFGHDNDISDLWIGKVIEQGEIFYQTGNYGPGNGGVHSHVTCIGSVK